MLLWQREHVALLHDVYSRFPRPHHGFFQLPKRLVELRLGYGLGCRETLGRGVRARRCIAVACPALLVLVEGMLLPLWGWRVEVDGFHLGALTRATCLGAGRTVAEPASTGAAAASAARTRLIYLLGGVVAHVVHRIFEQFKPKIYRSQHIRVGEQLVQIRGTLRIVERAFIVFLLFQDVQIKVVEASIRGEAKRLGVEE